VTVQLILQREKWSPKEIENTFYKIGAVKVRQEVKEEKEKDKEKKKRAICKKRVVKMLSQFELARTFKR